MNTIINLVKDGAVRLSTVLVTIYLILNGSSLFVTEYIYLLTVFNVTAIVMNLGSQFYTSTGIKFRSAFNRIHLLSVLIAGSLWVFGLVSALAVSSFLLGLLYARCDEFRLRRLGAIYSLLYINIIIALPRLLCFELDIKLDWANIISIFLIAPWAFRSGKLLVSGQQAVNVMNFAWMSSVLYVVYQNVPPYLDVQDGVSDYQRYEQILFRVIFAFMFIKSSLVISLMKTNFSLGALGSLRWLLLIVGSALVLFDAVEFGVYYYVIAFLLFVVAELIFAPVSASKHREYRYFSFMVDVFILLVVSSVLVYFDYPLLVSYALASVVLLIIRYENPDVKENT